MENVIMTLENHQEQIILPVKKRRGHQMLQTFKSQRGKTSKGRIYGIGSAQYRDFDPTEKVAVSMSRNLDNEMRISGLEENNATLKKDMVVLKAGMGKVMDELTTTRLALTAIMQSLGVQIRQPAAADTPARASADATPRGAADAPSATAAAFARDGSPAAASPAAPTVPSTRTQQGNLDAWCASLGL